MPTLDYKLVIRNASTTANPNGTADAFVVTSTRTGVNPYIASVPSGDGYEVDAITGAVRTGNYTLQIADAITGSDATGIVRAFTSQLEDGTNQQQLLSRRAYVYTSSNGGSTWSVLYAGYVSAIRLVSAALYELSIADSRRVEQTQTIFTGNTLGTFTTRGCLTGGPVTTTWGPVVSRGGWFYRVSSVPGNQNIVLNFIRGYDSFANAPTVTDWKKLVRQSVVNEISKSTAIIPDTSLGYPVGYADIVLHIGTTQDNAVPTSHILLANSGGPAYSMPGYGPLSVWWSNPATIPANNSYLFVSLYTRDVTEACPLYIDAHPVDIVTQIWDAARIYWKNSGDPNPAWVANIRSVIGPNVRLALRLTEPPVIASFLESAIFGPFGVSVRINPTTGAQELFDTRARGSGTPAISITASDMTNGNDVVFDLDERTAISTVSLTQQVFRTNYTQQGTEVATTDTPSDGVLMQTAKGIASNGDTTVFAGREISFDVPGMIHTADNFAPNVAAMLSAIAVPIYSRFGRGSQAADVSVLATSSAATLQVGDEVNFLAPHYPNANYRIGEMTSPVGRVMQVIRRTETPIGPTLRLLDVGLNQPSSPAAQIEIRKSLTQGGYVAEFRLPNASAMASAYLSAEVQWYVGASAPTNNGASFAVYGWSGIPTGWVALPSVPAGSRVWVRARSQAYQRRASSWTSWAATNVTLDALNGPSGLVLSGITATSATLTWTNTNTSWPVGVYLYQGASSPASWLPFKIGALTAATTTTTIRDGIVNGLPYRVALAYDTPNGPSYFTEDSFTSSGATATLTRPAGIAVIPGISDATLTQGVVLALWANNTSYNIAVYRAPDASGVPGTYSLLDVVNGTETTYIDLLAENGALYWYAIAHRSGGFTESALTPAVQAQASGVPSALVRPSAIAPTITPETTGEASQVSLSVTITADPQNRVDYVQMRTKYHGGAWSSWTTTTTASVATLNDGITSEIGWRVWGFTSDGEYGILREGQSAWPLNLGINPTVNKLTRSRFNSASNKYEIWYRFYLPLGNGELLEDPILGFITSSGPVPSSIKDQNGNLATGLYYDPTKQADGWYVSWNSTSSQQWTFELSSYGAYEELIFPYQNTDQQVTPFPATAGSATFVVPSGSGGSAGGDVVGPATATDNAIVRFDGTTGKLIKNSSATLTDAGTLTTTTGAFTNLSSTNTITGSISGNAATVTNGVYTTGSYSNPSWITALAGSKITGNISGNAANVTGVVAIANGGTNQTAYSTTGSGTRVAVYDQLAGKFDVVTAGSSGQFLRSSGTTGDVLWATPPNFTSSTAGYAPASGGGTTNFLRADGTWASPPTTTTISANNVTAGTFPGTNYYYTNDVTVYGTLTASNTIAGSISGNAATATTASSATTATTATRVTLNATASSSTFYLTMGTGAGGSQDLYVDNNNLTYVPSTDTLYVTNLNGNALTATSAASAVNANYATSAGNVSLAQNTWLASTGSVNLLRDSYFGYSVGYRVAQLGVSGASRAISIGADLTGNPSGSFTGNEIVIPNNRAMIAANAANNGYAAVLKIDGGNNLCLGGSDYTTSGHIYINNSSGNVGIGTASPAERLHVIGNLSLGSSSNSTITYRTASNWRYNLGAVNDDFFIYDAQSVNYFAAYYNGGGTGKYASILGALNVKNDGNVGIGTTSPTEKLHIEAGNVYVNGETQGVIVDAQGTKRVGFMKYPGFEGALVHGNAVPLRFGQVNQANVTGGTFAVQMLIDTSGNVGINTNNPTEKLHVVGNILASQNVTAYSDARVKANIEVIGNALTKVRAIRGVTFTRTDTHDATQRHAGVIAQEIEAVLPEVVGENGAGMKHVAYGNIVALLIEAVKELADIVESRQ